MKELFNSKPRITKVLVLLNTYNFGKNKSSQNSKVKSKILLFYVPQLIIFLTFMFGGTINAQTTINLRINSLTVY
jgi:hypothetical protein